MDIQLCTNVCSDKEEIIDFGFAKRSSLNILTGIANENGYDGLLYSMHSQEELNELLALLRQALIKALKVVDCIEYEANEKDEDTTFSIFFR